MELAHRSCRLVCATVLVLLFASTAAFEGIVLSGVCGDEYTWCVVCSTPRESDVQEGMASYAQGGSWGKGCVG